MAENCKTVFRPRGSLSMCSYLTFVDAFREPPWLSCQDVLVSKSGWSGHSRQHPVSSSDVIIVIWRPLWLFHLSNCYFELSEVVLAKWISEGISVATEPISLLFSCVDAVNTRSLLLVQLLHVVWVRARNWTGSRWKIWFADIFSKKMTLFVSKCFLFHYEMFVEPVTSWLFSV